MTACLGGCGKEIDGLCRDCWEGAKILHANALRLARVSQEETSKHRAAIRQAIPNRRERIAIAAMQGMISANVHGDLVFFADFARDAVNQADALIAQLDEGRPALPTVHVVMPGETLSGIALRYYGDTKGCCTLASINRIADCNHIEPGWTIAIPKDLP